MTVKSINGVQPQVKQTGGTGKAVASAFIPGLGQFCDDRNEAGIGYLSGVGASTIAGCSFLTKYARDVYNAKEKASHEIFEAKSRASSKAFKTHDKLGKDFLDYAKQLEREATKNMLTPEEAAKTVKKGGLYTGAVLLIIGAGLWLANIVDAYKGNKK